MRRMSDWDYKYQPASDETRRRQSESHRRRLGIPPGYRIVAGFVVPEEQLAEAMAKIYPCEDCGGGRSTGAKRCKDCAELKAGNLKAEVLRRLRAGEPSAEIQSALQVTKGKVSGIAFRAGISLRAQAVIIPVATPVTPKSPAEQSRDWIIESHDLPYTGHGYWHNERRRRSGWFSDKEGALRFDNREAAQAYIRKFPRQLNAAPVCAHYAHKVGTESGT